MVENGWNGGRWWKMGGMVEDGGMVKKYVGGWNGGGWGSGMMENEVVRGSRREVCCWDGPIVELKNLLVGS